MRLVLLRKMRLIDSHTHIFAEEFDYDRSEAIQRAKDAGVVAMVMPNINSQSVDSLLSVAQQYPDYCFPCMGVHPTSVKNNFDDELASVQSWFAKAKFYAVGEIGIDLYWDKTFVEQQKEVFRQQLKMAKKFRLPVIIHARNSFHEIFKIVDQENDEDLGGVFHSFSGSLTDYEHIASYGKFLVGIGGVVTYKNGGVDKVVQHINLANVILETDSPYLSPVPQRGKRNESANLVYIASRIAEIKGISVQEVASVTTANATKLFSLSNL